MAILVAPGKAPRKRWFAPRPGVAGPAPQARGEPHRTECPHLETTGYRHLTDDASFMLFRRFTHALKWLAVIKLKILAQRHE
jgi:hypothetical protein